MQTSEQIATLLDALRGGDAGAADRLYGLLYDEFHGKAHHLLRLGPRQTLCTTELVNETWLRLQGRQIPIESREHFANLAARAMRQVLIDRIRHRQAQKRGDGEALLEIQAEDAGGDDPFEVLALHDTLQDLARVDPLLAQIAELHLFGGFSIIDIAAMLAVPERTAFRRWRTARMFLIRAISGHDALDPES
jgi:RNA polymerase sigma factor (TIGR02999 family)